MGAILGVFLGVTKMLGTKSVNSVFMLRNGTRL